MPDLERAARQISAARTLLENGFAPEAVSRAHNAAFYAAEQALAVLGERRARHSGVIAAFGRHVVTEGGLSPDLGIILVVLFQARNEADYGAGTISRPDAERAIADAERFIGGVGEWLEAQAGE